MKKKHPEIQIDMSNKANISNEINYFAHTIYWPNLYVLRVLLLIFLSYQPCYCQIFNYKEITAKKVFDRVSTAYGSGMNAPFFQLLPKSASKTQRLEYYPGDKPTVKMGEEVYDLCAKFGKDSLNALAALLGHELAHHYEKHDWCSSFSYLLGSDNALIKSINSQDKNGKQRIESEADYYGGFYGYVAGYNTYAVLPQVLEKLYAENNIPDNIPGYPTKAQRIEIARKKMEEVRKWVGIFDAGEFLFAIGQFNLAGSCFAFLTQKFPSKEVYNNAGVCYLFRAKSFLATDDMPFLLPIDFDPNTNLKSSLRSGNINEEQKKDSIRYYADLAISYFEKAKRTAPNYFNAQLNMGFADLLLNKNGAALDIALELMQKDAIKANKNNLSKAYTLKAIAEWKSKSDEAGNSFSTAHRIDDNSITSLNEENFKKLNKSLLQDIYDGFWRFFNAEEERKYTGENTANPLLEKIGDKNPKIFVPNANSKVKNTITPDGILLNHYEDNNTIDIVVNTNTQQTTFICTQPNYTGKTAKGIGMGDTVAKVKEQYGQPSETLNILNGNYYIYKKSKIVFHFNSADKVVKWFIYNNF